MPNPELIKAAHDLFSLDSAKEVVRDRLGEIIFGGVGTVVGALIARRASRKASAEAHEELRLQRTGEYEASMTHIMYVPVYGTEKFEQRVKEGKLIKLEDIFPKGQWPAISEYLKAAKELCTDADPIVFNHLDKVIPPEEQLVDKEEILRHWHAHFDEMYNPMTKECPSDEDALSYPSIKYLGAKKRYPEIRSDLYPILVSEPSAKHLRMRIFMMNANQLKNGAKLHEADVVIENADKPDPEKTNPSYHYLRTVRAISDLFWQCKLDNLLKQIKILVPRLSAPTPAALTAIPIQDLH